MINEISNEVKERVDALFPSIYNKIEDVSNDNTLASDNLWKTVGDKVAVRCSKILAPLDGIIMDIQPDLIVSNPDATPTVQVEVINSVGDALVDTTSWDGTAVNTKYVDVKLHRISRPFSLSYVDLMHGERVEGKVLAAAEVVAQGVVAQLAAAIADIDAETISDFGPEAAAKMSGEFEHAPAHALIASPAQYAKLIPTSTLGLNPDVEGVYGYDVIRKGTGLGDVLSLTKGAVAGAICTPAVLRNHGQGLDVRVIGSVAGFPLVLKSKYDWNETLKCSVECMAGFAVVNEDGIKKYTVQG